MEEAVDWLKKAPFGGGAEIEIRPFFETCDLGEGLSPELREKDRHLRERMVAKK
jgi:hypothetical protein